MVKKSKLKASFQRARKKKKGKCVDPGWKEDSAGDQKARRMGRK